jgi:hypothetical protein
MEKYKFLIMSIGLFFMCYTSFQTYKFMKNQFNNSVSLGNKVTESGQYTKHLAGIILGFLGGILCLILFIKQFSD